MGESDSMHIESDDAGEADGSGVTRVDADAGKGRVQASKETVCKRHDDGKDATAADDDTVTDGSAGSVDDMEMATASGSNDDTMGNPACSDAMDGAMEGFAGGTTVTDSNDGTVAAPDGDNGIDAEHSGVGEPHDDGDDDAEQSFTSNSETIEGTHAEDAIAATEVMPSPADGVDDGKSDDGTAQARDEDDTTHANDGDAPRQAAKTARDTKPSKRKRVIAAVCGIAAIAITAGCLCVWHGTASALSEASSAISSATITDSNTNGVLERTASFADLTDDDIMPDDGGDDGILAAYATARDAASTAVSEEMPSVDGIEWYDLGEARSARDDADRIAEEKHDALSTLRSAASIITTSRYERKCSDAKEALQSSSDSAQDVLDSTEDEVHDNAIRQTLADAIDAGNALLGEDGLLSANAYSSAQGRIDDASQAVSDDHAQWQKEKEEEEERARQAAAAAAAAKRYASRSQAAAAASSSGGTAAQASDGTWYVSYRGNDQEGTANSDCSVSEYRDGYYIAHRHGSNGKIIASKPSHVVVDGKSYHYVSSITVSDQSALDDALAYARQNGGIGFQTCTIPTGGDIIVHYEPDN